MQLCNLFVLIFALFLGPELPSFVHSTHMQEMTNKVHHAWINRNILPICNRHNSVITVSNHMLLTHTKATGIMEKLPISTELLLLKNYYAIMKHVQIRWHKYNDPKQSN